MIVDKANRSSEIKFTWNGNNTLRVARGFKAIENIIRNYFYTCPVLIKRDG